MALASIATKVCNILHDDPHSHVTPPTLVKSSLPLFHHCDIECLALNLSPQNSAWPWLKTVAVHSTAA